MLAKTPKDCTVFHPASNRLVTFAKLVDVFNELELNVEIVDDEIFDESLNHVLQDESRQDGIFGILTWLSDDDFDDEYLSYDMGYTLQVLSQFGFEWPQTSEKYLFDFIKSLKEMGFFKV